MWVWKFVGFVLKHGKLPLPAWILFWAPIQNWFQLNHSNGSFIDAGERERERVLVLSVRALFWQLFLEGENLELSLSCILVGFDPFELKVYILLYGSTVWAFWGSNGKRIFVWDRPDHSCEISHEGTKDPLFFYPPKWQTIVPFSPNCNLNRANRLTEANIFSPVSRESDLNGFCFYMWYNAIWS